MLVHRINWIHLLHSNITYLLLINYLSHVHLALGFASVVRVYLGILECFLGSVLVHFCVEVMDQLLNLLFITFLRTLVFHKSKFFLIIVTFHSWVVYVLILGHRWYQGMLEFFLKWTALCWSNKKACTPSWGGLAPLYHFVESVLRWEVFTPSLRTAPFCWISVRAKFSI